MFLLRQYLLSFLELLYKRHPLIFQLYALVKSIKTQRSPVSNINILSTYSGNNSGKINLATSPAPFQIKPFNFVSTLSDL